MSTHDPFSAFFNKVLHGNPSQDLIDAGLPALRRLFASYAICERVGGPHTLLNVPGLPTPDTFAHFSSSRPPINWN